MQSNLNIINQYLETPIDLEGKAPGELLKKKKRRRTRRKREPTPGSDAEEDGDAERASDRKKREKRRKEKQQYKSAEFVVDESIPRVCTIRRETSN